MASTSSFAISPSNAPGSFTPTIVATTLIIADTEYAYTMPAGTGTFFIQVKNGGAVRFAYQTGATATEDCLRIGANGFYSREAILNSASYTLYFRSLVAGTIVAVESWKT